MTSEPQGGPSDKDVAAELVAAVAAIAWHLVTSLCWALYAFGAAALTLVGYLLSDRKDR